MVIVVGKTTEELIRDLSILNNVGIKGLKQKLQNMTRKCEVPITHNVLKFLVKGWQGEPKGLLQFLWERGFIDPSNPKSYYAMKITRDDHQNIRPDS